MTAMTSFRSNSPLTRDELFAYAPSVFATEAHGSRSDKFVPVPTIDVLGALAKEGFQPFSIQQAKTRVAGKADFTKHIVRMRSADAPLPKIGGVWPELLLINGNDGSASYKLMLGAYRFVCANGMISGDTYTSVNVRHAGRSVLDDVIEGTYSVISDAPRLTQQINDWSDVPVSRDEAMLLAEAVHSMRFPEAHLPKDDEGFKEAPVTAQRLLTARRWDDQNRTNLWTVTNVLQENVIRGGLRGLGQRSGRTVRATTRAVNGIDQSTNLNRAIWTLSEEFAKLKQAA